MIRARRSTQEDPSEVAEGRATHDVAITPLAIPMLAGPAGLSTVATLLSRADGLADKASVYAAVAITGVVSYLTLVLAGPLQARFGQTGIHVLSRLFGLVLAGIAVQFVLDGLKAAGFPVGNPG
jgi:multiple antibiotic resistance protein